jgi:hypothetical protein
MSTPGPRKFLPQSSSSQFKIPKPAWRTPGLTTQPSRSSSSLKQPPPSQFAKTPRFATSNDSIDEIDGNFGQGSSSPTEVKTQGTFRTGHSVDYDDLLVEEDDDLEANLKYSKTWIAKAEEAKPHRYDHHEDTRKPPRLGDMIQDGKVDDFPQPTLKRFRTSTETTKHHDAILISSSGSEDDANYHSNHHGHNDDQPKGSRSDAFDLDSDLDDLLPSSPTLTRPSTTTSTLARFKTPAAPTSTLPSSKPIFKPQPASLSNLHTTPLPDTFSPSRRRGKRDYIPGGLADTVRGWVLELGTSISKPGASTELSKTVRVARVQHDIEGRCATVQDELGERYLLVNQGQGREVGDLRVGHVVEMQGEGTSWGIELEVLVDGRVDEVGGERAEAGRTVNVCVLWKLKQ